MAIGTEISTAPLDVAKALTAVAHPGQGATDVFVGHVRNHHEGRRVTGITYDVHEALARTVLHEICAEAEKQWPETHYFAAHFQGSLPVGGISVLVAVSAPHRAESFAACRYVIEEIKKRLPVWKQEHYPDGPSAWLPGHSLKEAAHG